VCPIETEILLKRRSNCHNKTGTNNSDSTPKCNWIGCLFKGLFINILESTPNRMHVGGDMPELGSKTGATFTNPIQSYLERQKFYASRKLMEGIKREVEETGHRHRDFYL
jgi:hypothetical protein